MQGALGDLEKMEDMFFGAVAKSAQSAGAPLQGPWEKALEAMKLKGSSSGMVAAQSVEDLLAQARSALRGGRAAGLKATQALMQGYSTLVSGVLIGMAEGLQPPAAAKKAAPRKSAS